LFFESVSALALPPLLFPVGTGSTGRDSVRASSAPPRSGAARVANEDLPISAVELEEVWYSSAANIARLGRVARTYASASETKDGLAARAQSVARRRKRGRRKVIVNG